MWIILLALPSHDNSMISIQFSQSSFSEFTMHNFAVVDFNPILSMTQFGFYAALIISFHHLIAKTLVWKAKQNAARLFLVTSIVLPPALALTFIAFHQLLPIINITRPHPMFSSTPSTPANVVIHSTLMHVKSSKPSTISHVIIIKYAYWCFHFYLHSPSSIQILLLYIHIMFNTWVAT